MGTRMYKIEFMWGKVTKITMNIIAELMYAQSKRDGNEYLVLDALVDY